MKFKYYIDESTCTNCSGCSSVCPVRAIKIKDSLAEINSNCISCNKCYQFCPVDAVKRVELT